MNSRRDFLRSLAALPLIGGSVALIGQPSAVAEPVTMGLLEAYKTWLDMEHRELAWSMAEMPEVVAYHGGDRRHRFDCVRGYTLCDSDHVGQAGHFHSFDGEAPARAALVLSTVGCDWRRGS